MRNTTLNTRKADLQPRLRTIRSTWSSDERRRRAERGRRRTVELFQMIFNPNPEPEIWAVGAPACDDVRRLAS